MHTQMAAMMTSNDPSWPHRGPAVLEEDVSWPHRGPAVLEEDVSWPHRGASSHGRVGQLRHRRKGKV